jgi:hypothetical protein
VTPASADLQNGDSNLLRFHQTVTSAYKLNKKTVTPTTAIIHKTVLIYQTVTPTSADPQNGYSNLLRFHQTVTSAYKLNKKTVTPTTAIIHKTVTVTPSTADPGNGDSRLYSLLPSSAPHSTAEYVAASNTSKSSLQSIFCLAFNPTFNPTARL